MKHRRSQGLRCSGRGSLAVLLFATLILFTPCPRLSALEVEYSLPRDGRVSLAVYDTRGLQVRTLLAGEPLTKGNHKTSWDGLDREGKPVPAGSYTWKLLMNDGLESEYITVVGQNPVDPAQPWQPTIGSHQGPSSVVLGAGGSLYHGGRNAEGPPVVMKLGSKNGPVLWTRNWQTKGPVDMEEIGKHLYVLGWDCTLQRVDAENGKDDGKPVDLLWPGDKRSGIDDPVASYPIKMGTDGMRLVIAYRDHDVLRWIDPSSGAVQREVQVRKPRAVSSGEAGAVFVLSDRTVVAIAPDGKSSTVIGDGVLTAPATLDYDRVNRQILVADGGTDQRVRRFAADGKPLATYGRQGGRLDGRYVKTDFRDVSHLTCDRSGGFYAVESDHVRRIVHVAADKSVIKEWHGGTPFFAVTSVDAAAPRQLWYNSSYTMMAVADLNPDTKSWTITHSYSMPEKGMGQGLFPAAGEFPVWRVKQRAGLTYLYHESPPAILRVDEAGRRLVPVALASHKSWEERRKESIPLKAALARNKLQFTDEASDGFTWSDTNGNGEMDPEEFRFYKMAAPVLGPYCAFDDNWNVYIGFFKSKNYVYANSRWLLFDFKGSAYVKLPNLAATGAAAPVWDWSRLEHSAARIPSDLAGNSGAEAVRWDPRGGVTLSVRGEFGGDHADRHGVIWPNGQIGKAHLLRATATGVQWTVSKHESPGMPPAAVLRYPGYLPGTTHGCIIVSDRNKYGATAWTEDGLFAGFFLDRHVKNLPDWVYDPYGRGLLGILPGDDWECGGSLTDLADGSVLWIPRHASGRSPVYRVRGWNNWFRSEGTLRLSAASMSADGTGTGLSAAYFRGTAFAGQPVVERTDPRLWFQQVKSQGPFASWSDGPCSGIAAGQPFSVRWKGRVVAPYSERFWFRVYNQFKSGAHVSTQWWVDRTGFARVWLNDVLIIDQSPNRPPGQPFEAGPVRLEAGRSYELKVEYVSPGNNKPEFSLSWACETRQWERIPTRHLYPDATAGGPVIRVAATSPQMRTSPVNFVLGGPAERDLAVRYRMIGRDFTTRYGEVVVKAGTSTATIVPPTEQGRVVVVLDPDWQYRGDGSAGMVAAGSHPVATGLAAYYQLDEREGEIAHDSAGSAHGSFEKFLNPPVPRWAPDAGRSGGALEFHEPGLKLALPSVAISGDFTVGFWIRTKKSGQPMMLGNFDLWLKDGRPEMIFNGWPLAPKQCPRLDDGMWHHLAFVWDQTGGKRRMSLHVDGVEVGNATGPGQGSLKGLTLGASNNFKSGPEPFGFVGVFDDVRVYNRKLQPAELQMLSRIK